MTPLSRRLRRLRRRERFGRVFCNSAVAVAAVIAAAPWMPSMGSAAMLASIALGAAGIAAWIATPDLRAIAAAADRALHLDDRVVTALQHYRDADAFSRLVVADAERRLAAVPSSRVFPLSLPRWFAPIGIVAVLAAAAGYALRAQPAPATTQASAPSRDGGAAGTPPDGRRGATDSASPAATETQRTIVTPQAAAGTEPRQIDAASGAPRRDNTQQVQPIAQPGGGAAGAGATPPRDLASGRAPGARGRFKARGAAGSTRGGTTDLAGGVSQGSLREARERDTQSGAPTKRAARARPGDRAESAIAGGGIPPGLNAYVRAYFAAIHR
jgi:hypothetical protein